MSRKHWFYARFTLLASGVFTAGSLFAQQQPPASVEWSLAGVAVPAGGIVSLGLLGLVLVTFGLLEMRRRRSIVGGLLLLPVVAGLIMTLHSPANLIETIRANLATTPLISSPTELGPGVNLLENVQSETIRITALNNGSCEIDQSIAQQPACQVGDTINPGGTCSVYVNCGGDGMQPGSSEAVSAVGIDNTGTIDFRCQEWQGTKCIHPQARMPSSTCANYEDADVWHDMVYVNSPEDRICPSFCAGVSSSGVVASCEDTGIAPTLTAGGNVTAGWSASETGCINTGDARWRIDYPGQNGNLNIKFNSDYSSSNILAIECAWDAPLPPKS